MTISKLAPLAAMALVALTLGCSSDTALTPQGGPDGTYLLQSANGATSPAYLYSWKASATDTGSVYILADTLEITADGKYRDNAWLETRSGNTVLGRLHEFDRGVVTRDGATLHFESNYLENVTFDATLSNDGRFATSRALLPETDPADYVLRRR